MVKIVNVESRKTSVFKHGTFPAINIVMFLISLEMIMDLLKKLLKPEFGNLALWLIGFILLGRSFYYFLIDQSFAYVCVETSCLQPQGSIKEIFDKEIPMVLMTILWPVIFAFFNTLHPKIRIKPIVFYIIILIHTLSALIAGYSVYDAGTIGQHAKLADTDTRTIQVVCLTLVSAITSIYIYVKRFTVFVKT
jgi:hypothetical protein